MRPSRIFAASSITALLLFVACKDQTNPTGVKVPDGDVVVPDGGAPTTTPTTNPDGTSTKHLCKVSKVGDQGKVISGTLMLPDGPVDGDLVIDATGMITCADKDCSADAAYATATKIACTEVAISPGLVNAHDHISYANNPPPLRTDEKYEHRHDWREGIRGHTKIPTNAPTVPNAVAAAELRFLMSGMTSTASGGSAGSGAPGLARNIDSNTAQLEGLDIQLVVSDTFPLADSSGTLSTTCSGFSASRETAAEIAGDKGYLPHIAEGVDADAHEEFICQSDSDTTPDPTHNLVQRQTGVIHSVAVLPSDVAKYRKQEATLIWSPRSNISLYGNTAPIPVFVNSGVPVALGTDWLPSGSMNMSRELACADMVNAKYFNGALSDRQLWQSVTTNAAFATGTDYAIGMLKKGLVGDIAIFDASAAKSPYRAVIEAGVEDTILVLRGGKTMYGDSELISEIGDGDCEDMDVCKVTKKACVSKDSGGKTTLADLQTAATKVYPLFYCKGDAIKNEPTCTPARGPTAADNTATVYSGVPSATDKDGDGIDDGNDNCPGVFNPIRVMDSGKQSDVDGDGKGDVCDSCPLDPADGCTPPDSDDIDGDGVANEDDNCPKDANADQTDADGDGKGAACDVCDNAPNPGNSLCPAVFTISQIRDPSAAGHPQPGSARATIKNVVVTALKNGGSPAGFWVQDDTVQTFGGLFVLSTTTVAVGNRVDVTGDYTEFDGTSELNGTTVVTVVDAGTTLNIQPIVTDPATMIANGEPTEAMLCVVNGPISVTVMNADAPSGDFDEFEVGPANLRVDDFAYDALDNTFPVGTTFQKIVGICGWSHGNRKMWPRSMDDLPQ